MTDSGKFSLRLPDGATITYISGSSREPNTSELLTTKSSSLQGTGTANSVDTLRVRLQNAHRGASIKLLANAADVDLGVDPDKFKKKIDELGYDDFFKNFSDNELEIVLNSVERLGQTGVDESDPGNLFAHKVFDLFATAIKAKLNDDLSASDFQRSALARDIPQIFARDFLADLEKLRATLIRSPELKNSATNLLAYLHKVANYEAPDPAEPPPF